MAKDILKEAIADAKAVREVALANAKAALEEAFTPKLQSMLSARLSEDMDEEMMDEEKTEETYMDEDMDETYMDEEMDETVGMEKEEKEMEEDLDEEIDLEEILNELELEEGEEANEEKVEEAKDEDLDEAKKDDKDDVKEAKDEDLEEAKDDEKEMEEAVGYPNHRADQVQKVKHDATDINQGLNEGEEFDLDALLEEINNLEEEKEDKDDVKEGDFGEAEETNEVVGAAIAGTAAAIIIGGTPLVAAKAAYDMVSPEKKAELMKKYPKLSKLMDTLGLVGSAAADTKRTESLSEAEKTATEDELAKMEKALASGSSMEEDMYQEELEETKAALEAVRTELNEVNLLNSKLLYVNRIFKANTLDESQKLRVVETLDKAETAKEAKLIYETIKDTFNVAKSKKESFKSKTKSLKEGIGMASKAAGTSTAPKKEVISESNNMMARFQKLANIKISQ